MDVYETYIYVSFYTEFWTLCSVLITVISVCNILVNGLNNNFITINQSYWNSCSLYSGNCNFYCSMVN